MSPHISVGFEHGQWRQPADLSITLANAAVRNIHACRFQRGALRQPVRAPCEDRRLHSEEACTGRPSHGAQRRAATRSGPREIPGVGHAGRRLPPRIAVALHRVRIKFDAKCLVRRDECRAAVACSGLAGLRARQRTATHHSENPRIPEARNLRSEGKRPLPSRHPKPGESHRSTCCEPST